VGRVVLGDLQHGLVSLAGDAADVVEQQQPISE
jgi:hypothetical protein